MNKKGITPVIAVVLLMMMTIAAAGAAYFWMTSIQSKISEQAEQEQEGMTSIKFVIDYVFCNDSADGGAEIPVKTVVYNSGTKDITSEEVWIYILNTTNEAEIGKYNNNTGTFTLAQAHSTSDIWGTYTNFGLSNALTSGTNYIIKITIAGVSKQTTCTAG